MAISPWLNRFSRRTEHSIPTHCGDRQQPQAWSKGAAQRPQKEAGLQSLPDFEPPMVRLFDLFRASQGCHNASAIRRILDEACLLRKL
jgi:hypothetical protein